MPYYRPKTRPAFYAEQFTETNRPDCVYPMAPGEYWINTSGVGEAECVYVMGIGFVPTNELEAVLDAKRNGVW